MRNFNEAERRIIAAWRVPGSHPGYHLKQIERLKRDWPVLAGAIIALVNEASGDTRFARKNYNAYNDTLSL